MKIQTNKTVYRCEYCNKSYFIANACSKHETFCYKNPSNTPACSGCRNIEEIEKEIWIDTHMGERVLTKKAFRCKAKGIGLYPLKVLRGDMLKNYPDTFEGEELMPTDCDLRNDNFSF